MSGSAKVLIVGEAPSQWMERNRVTTPLPLARWDLARLAGVSMPQFNELFECVNVLDKWPGRGSNGKNDLFPMELARLAVAKMDIVGRRVIFLGRRVESAFRLSPLPLSLFTWQQTFGEPKLHWAVSPHPSHANRWWNDINNRRDAAIFWGEVAKSTQEAQFHEKTGGVYR